MVPEFSVYQDLTKSLILTFSLLPILLKKLVSCCFLYWKQSKFAWYHLQLQIAFLGEFFAWGALCKVPSFCRTISGPFGRVPDVPPNSQVIAVPVVWLVPKQESQIFVYIPVNWELFRVVYPLETIVSMHQILWYTWYSSYTLYIATIWHDVETEYLESFINGSVSPAL